MDKNKTSPLPPNVTNSQTKPQQTPSVEEHSFPLKVGLAVAGSVSRYIIIELAFQLTTFKYYFTEYFDEYFRRSWMLVKLWRVYVNFSNQTVVVCTGRQTFTNTHTILQSSFMHVSQYRFWKSRQTE